MADRTATTERLTATAMASDGRAVARSRSGKVVFVEGALPGETVTARLEADHARYARAHTVEVIDPAPARVDPPCPRLREGCGGCQWQHISADGQRRLKAAMVDEALRPIGRLDEFELFPTIELAPWNWRTTIRAGVDDGRASLRQARSHDLVPIEGCLIAHPLLAPLLEGRRYHGASSVLLRCGSRTGDRLVAASPGPIQLDVPADVSAQYFHEEAAGRRWRVSARSFFQSRPDGADALARLVVRAAEGLMAEPGGRRAVDAYSGVGLFAGVLASRGWSVVAVEGSHRSAEDARANLSGLDVDVVRSDVTRWRPAPADLVVADPSRAGLGRAGVSVLTGTGAARIVLVSCDVASLGRDAGLLARAGYRLSSVTPVDMFPQTWHVEVVRVRPGHGGKGGRVTSKPAPEPAFDAARILLDGFSRIREGVRGVLEGIEAPHLTWRPDPEANTIAWLVWHLTRVEDDHVAGAFGVPQLWDSAGWDGRFGLPLPAGATGYGMDASEVAKVEAPAELLLGYQQAVASRTESLVTGVGPDDLARVVDKRWDPPVTLEVRLVSVVADSLQHVGQAAYVRGLAERSG